MHTTPVSLLDRLRRSADDADWRRLVHLYTPLLYAWARRAGATEHEAADVVQDAFMVLVKSLSKFDRNQGGRFRGWLRTIALNSFRTRKRRESAVPEEPLHALDEIAVPDGVEEFWEREYAEEMTARALRLMQADFSTTTWQACWKFVAEGRPALDVARELGISENAVYLAKCHVVRRLRHELGGLVD
jgi:RNA polymerase sigma-70 factor, ECF subfamily